MYKIGWLAILIALTFIILMPVAVMADTAAPNTTAINESHVWRNVLETGDYLLVCRYAVNYTSVPALDIDETFTFRLMAANNTYEYGAVNAYPYQNKGYGQGIVSWYFDADNAPPWGQTYWIRLEGKAIAFDDPPIYTFNLAAMDYSGKTVRSEVQAEIAEILIEMAKTVGGSWSPAVELTEEGETSTILSTYGEAYFRPAIPGIQTMSPGLFFLQIYDVTVTAEAWSTNQSDAAAGIVQNTTAGEGVSGVADLFNMSFSVVAMIPIVLLCIVLMVLGAIQQNIIAGIMGSSFVLTTATAFGWFPMPVLMIIAFFSGVFILYHILFKNS